MIAVASGAVRSSDCVRRAGILGLVFLIGGVARAQSAQPSPTPAKSEEKLSLEELLNLDTAVAGGKATTVREAPGVVTLITRDRIIESGARDMIDVLNLVPGFTLALDLQGSVDVAFRGIWGHEGKVLWLLDGQTMNELMYCTMTLGNHFPVDQIERVEIIRGPGSVVYGGFAELAVINIVTRGAHELNGGAISVTAGEQTRGLGEADVSASWGRVFENGMQFSASIFAGRGQRSDQPYSDFAGASYDMNGNSSLDPRLLNASFAWKGFSARGIVDDYVVGSRDGYTAAYSRAYDTHFTSAIGEVKYEWSPTWGVLITPHVSLTHQLPWYVSEHTAESPFYEKTVERAAAGVSASWDVRSAVNLVAGVESFQDHAWLDAPADNGLQSKLNGGDSVSHQNIAGYGQVLWRSPLGDLLAGARFENHSAVGTSFVPRAAFTRQFGRAHLKLLAAQAFRAPGVENISLNPAITPERTTVFEAEAGVQLTDELIVTGNVFDVTVRHPIIYAVVGTATDGYFNFGQTGSRGGELEVQARFPSGSIVATASYSSPSGKNDVSLYRVPGHADSLLGIPNYKATLLASIMLGHGVTLAPSIVHIGPRYGFLSGDGTGAGVLDLEPSATLLNVFLNTRGLLLDGLEAGLGVYDVLDSKLHYLQPYDGGHAPLPARSRELVGRASFRF